MTTFIATPFVTAIIGIWACATVGSLFTRNADPFAFSTITTLLMGVGYFLFHLIK